MWRLGSSGRRAAGGSDAGRQAGAAKAAKPGGLRIALLLFLFGGSLVLPAIAGMVFLLERNWRVHERYVERRLVQVAKDLSDDVDRELELLMATLNGLGSSPEVTAGDWAAMHERASHTLKPLGIELLYRDLSGQQVMNTRVRWGAPLPRSLQPEIDAAVARTMKPQIADMIVGTVAGRPLITITGPVLRGESLQGFLHLSILPDRFLAAMRGQSLPLEWNTGLSDRRGVVIARLHRHADFVGKQLPAELATETSEGTVARSINLEGVPSVRAAYRSPLSGWLVSADVPLSVAQAALRQDTLAIIGASACLLLLCLALALLFARLITRPLRAVAGFAETVERGDVPPLMNSPVREANEIAAGLQSVGLRLRDRTQELRGTVARFNAALRGADIVVYALDRERKVTWMSETAAPVGELIGRGGEELLPPDIHEQAAQVEAQALASGQPQEAEVQHGEGDAARHFRLHIEPVRGSDGLVIGLLGVSSEVTALRRAERRNALLVHEIGHRAKNILATVQAIAAATLRGSTSLPEFRTRFNERLRALATPHHRR